MGYMGGIDYVSPEFSTVWWAEVRSPWMGVQQGEGGGSLVILGATYDFDPGRD
jgi:hypothetical protein